MESPSAGLARRLLASFVVVTVASLGPLGTGTSASAGQAPMNGRIAYTQNPPDKDRPSGYTLNADGTGRHLVGERGSTECETWSPDGGKLLCNFWGPPAGVQPGVADPDGSNFHLLNNDLPLDLFCTHWSPDGALLLCHSEGFASGSDAGLFTVRSSDGGGLQRVTTQPKGFGDSANGFSPDGSHILFSRLRDDAPGNLYSVDLDGSNLTRLSPRGLRVLGGGAQHLGASWAPSGDRVTFAAQDISKSRFKSAVYIVSGDGTDLQRVPGTGVGARTAQWSPDGRWIGFAANGKIWAAPPIGGKHIVTSATNSSGSFGPVWSPDSTKLLFVRFTAFGDRTLSHANVDGSGLTKVVDVLNVLEFSWGTAQA